jgi:hypothetical protein
LEKFLANHGRNDQHTGNYCRDRNQQPNNRAQSTDASRLCKLAVAPMGLFRFPQLPAGLIQHETLSAKTAN